MTQHELIKEYLQEFGYIIPAKMGGKFYKGHIFGSEVGKRCRELREKGILTSEKEGKFEKYGFNFVRHWEPVKSNYQSSQVVTANN